MLASRWRAVDTMYQELSMQPGPSVHTARRAKAAGWVTPLAWDNIDNPNEAPSVGGHDDDIDPVVVMRLLNGHNIPATRAERTETIRRWVADGRPTRELNQLYGWKIERYWKHGAAA
jgi:hypothetical protein